MTFAELRTMIGIHPAAHKRLPRAMPLPGSAQEDLQTVTLADAPPGSQVQVAQFISGLSGDRQAHLRAYGLAPGRWLHVKQHNPVTVIQIDQTELALEDTLARLVSVSLKYPV